jgi:membrane protein implicated in regulation of membrane protease activity
MRLSSAGFSPQHQEGMLNIFLQICCFFSLSLTNFSWKIQFLLSWDVNGVSLWFLKKSRKRIEHKNVEGRR